MVSAERLWHGFCHSVGRKEGLFCAISRGGKVLVIARGRALLNVALGAETIEEKLMHLTAFM